MIAHFGQNDSLDVHNQGILELTGLIADWRPGDRSQLVYLRESAKGLIVANRLVEGQKQLVAQHLKTPEGFHNLILTPQVDSALTPYHSLLTSIFSYPSLFNISSSTRASCYRKLQGLLYTHFKIQHKTLFQLKQELAFFNLAEIRSLQQLLLPSLSQFFTDPGSPISPTKRFRWLPDEDQQLLGLVEAGRSFSAIAQTFSPRSPAACASRYRTLLPGSWFTWFLVDFHEISPDGYFYEISQEWINFTDISLIFHKIWINFHEISHYLINFLNKNNKNNKKRTKDQKK
jgi:hypothetical protein